MSGQQHGFVPLDCEGEVIRPAEALVRHLDGGRVRGNHGEAGWIQSDHARDWQRRFAGLYRLENSLAEKKRTEEFRRLATVLLPHDYLNFWLTGEKVMEYGDASGTALLDVRKRRWSKAVLEAIDPDLEAKLPPLISSDKPAGHLQISTAKALGLNTDVLVSAGGGDNMMGAIGTGNTSHGVITASFGTSGTIYACAGKPVIDPKGEIAAFCDSTNQWLPLLCTMNVTVATEMVRNDFGMDHKKFEAAAAKAPPGSGGPSLAAVLRRRAHTERPRPALAYFLA